MTATPRRPLDALPHMVGRLTALDAAAKPIAEVARKLPPGTLKDLLSGTPIGHALHPLLTDLVIGSWTSATLLDLLGGERAEDAARRLITVGIAAYPATAVTGLLDWADGEPVSDEVRRVGFVHAGLNAVGLALYVASLASRRRGARRRGTALALAGSGWMAIAGHLGGHLAYRLGIGVDQTAFDAGPQEWTDAMAADQAGSAPVGIQVGDTPVLIVRDGDDLLALHDRCSHRGCSLAGGVVDGGSVTCPCHGSVFDLRSGAVRRGPATAPQPVLDARMRDGRIEVRQPQ